MKWCGGVGIGLLAGAGVLAACGSSDQHSAPAGAAGTGVTSSGGSAGTVVSAQGGASGSGGDATAGRAGGAPGGGLGGAVEGVDCSGTFGEPQVLIASVPNVVPESLSITGDDLELFYVEHVNNGFSVLSQRRASRGEGFGAATELPSDLFASCPIGAEPSIDVSDDGLRLYFTCINDGIGPDGGTIAPGQIRMASRADRSSAFVLAAEPLGSAALSISVSADELTAFWSDYSDALNPKAAMAQRSTLAEPFGDATSVPGVDTVFRFPELANDNLHLFGAVSLEAGTSRIVMLARSSISAPFDAPSAANVVIPAPPPDDNSDAAIQSSYDVTPTVSGDCRSLYFLRQTVLDGRATFVVYSASR